MRAKRASNSWRGLQVGQIHAGNKKRCSGFARLDRCAAL
ncbi:hypothetical protein T190_04365 [Sinorhizobium meliloti CCBAU 01290]|nr:hypothetical protein T190_04365 [Sinorhizobium meliloti CCBAU 01290]